jgi:hypothetical protein
MNLVSPMDEYLEEEAASEKELRISGFKLLKDAGLRIPKPIYIVTDKAFSLYLHTQLPDGSRRLPQELRKALDQAFLSIVTSGKGRGVAVRRSYFTPGSPNRPGIRSPVVRTPVAMRRYVKEIFDFAIKYKFHLSVESRIAAILHPFIDPIPPEPGGSVCVVDLESERIIVVEALYGNDEGVLILPHDDYWFSYGDLRIIEGGTTMRKKLCVSLGVKGTTHIVPVHAGLRDIPVLSVGQARYLASEGKKFHEFHRGRYRLDYDWTRDGAFFVEAARFDQRDFLEQYLPTFNLLRRGLRHRAPSTLQQKLRNYVTKSEEADSGRGLGEVVQGTVVLFRPNKKMNLSKDRIVFFDPASVGLGRSGIGKARDVRTKDQVLKWAQLLVDQLSPSAIVLIPEPNVHPYDFFELAEKEGKIKRVIPTQRIAADGEEVRITLNTRGNPVKFEKKGLGNMWIDWQ